MQDQAKLVGGGRVARGAVGGQVGLPGLDVVLGLAALALESLVEGPAAGALQAGDDEPGAAVDRRRRGGMITIPAGVRIHLAMGVTDMRKGFDGLAMLAQSDLSFIRAAFGQAKAARCSLA